MMVRVCMVLAALVVCRTNGDDNTVSNKLPHNINCQDPYVCEWDPNPQPYCLMSGAVVFGQCGLQKAICVDAEAYDPLSKCI